MIKHVDIYTAVLSEKNLCLYITASLSFALLITQNKSQRHASPVIRRMVCVGFSLKSERLMQNTDWVLFSNTGATLMLLFAWFPPKKLSDLIQDKDTRTAR